MPFILHSPFQPAGGQDEAIKSLVRGFKTQKRQTLLGITGSGKTFVMANVIESLQRPTLVLAHNKTLAAQLYSELKAFFPENRVEYFISYFDYYQPESYLPTSDTYIEKDSSVNEEIEKLRLHTVSSLLSREDVIVVASISCIYGISDPSDFVQLSLDLKPKQAVTRTEILSKLVQMQYERNDVDLHPGAFRVRGDVIDVIPAYEKEIVRIELFGDEVERLSELDHLTGATISTPEQVKIYPAKQFVVPEEKHRAAIESIKEEAKEHIPTLPELEKQRLTQRIHYDLEMLDELGYCSGIENYSRHFDQRKPGEPPFTLIDYFPKDWLIIIDESHQSVPQSRGMYAGDRSRKKNLIDYGFRLPSAYDNRPLRFEEFQEKWDKVLFVSATPAEYERQYPTTELIIRPTGLLDPEVEVRPTKDQIPDLIEEIKRTVQKDQRVLVTTLTKRMAEDLTNFFAQNDIRVRYLHSEVDSLDRIELIRQLRAKEFDVLVGINLLREGLDIPEVALVAILDADKEGYLRNDTSLLQTFGRAARNENGRVILYADRTTDSMRKAIAITRHRRNQQIVYNEKHGITPHTIQKSVESKRRDIKGTKHLSEQDIEKRLVELDAEMRKAAESLQFERAIELRDAIAALKDAL